MIFTAKTSGGLLCYIIAQQLPESRKEDLRSNSTVARINKLLGTNPVYFGTLLRLATIPTVIKNYGLALLAISLPQYLVCCVIGSCVYIPLQTYMGSTLGEMMLGIAPK